MRFFRSEETLKEWQAAQGTQAGEALTAPQIWDLSQRWYHNRLSPDYHGRSPAEAAAIFRAVGLTAGFWHPDR